MMKNGYIVMQQPDNEWPFEILSHVYTCNGIIRATELYVQRNYSCNKRCLFFRRLKIDHESHEFILESGTVANKDEFIVTLLLPNFHRKTSSYFIPKNMERI
jgi:hypothetical protein